MDKLLVEQIESIEYWTSQEGYYKLKYVVVNNPMMNVSNLIKIGGKYYRKNYKQYLSSEPNGVFRGVNLVQNADY